MKIEYKHKSPEAAERERRHQFGQPEGNKQGNPSTAVNQREFYRWCESQATEQELREYVRDESNPMARRKFVAQPKQVIEQTNLPDVRVVLE